jgi:acetylornithine deacetylase
VGIGRLKTVAQRLLDLVAMPSVSVQSNRPVADYVVASLDAACWKVHEHSYVDERGVEKINLVALSKNSEGNEVELALVCHADTVPFEASWQNAVEPVIRDGKLYGRGSCDVKGFLACALTALANTDIDVLQRPVALILTADEEIGCVGAKHLAASRAFLTQSMIIGEPTGLHPVHAGKGYALATITVCGKEAHSAFPAKGQSAIYHAARIILALEQLSKELEQQTHPDFDPPFTTLNVGLVHGGTAKNIIPGLCELTIEWRPVAGQRPDYVADQIQQLLKSLESLTPGFSAILDVKRMDPPFNPSRGRRILEVLSASSGKAVTTISFGSEAAHLAPLAAETVVFGPGDMTVAHKTGEFVPIHELDLCVRSLTAAIQQLCRDRKPGF